MVIVNIDRESGMVLIVRGQGLGMMGIARCPWRRSIDGDDGCSVRCPKLIERAGHVLLRCGPRDLVYKLGAEWNEDEGGETT